MSSENVKISPAGESRRERKKLEKLARIKAAAGDLFRENGFEGTTMRAIAEKADLAMGTLYLYAQDKLDLLFLIFSSDIERLQEEAFDRATLKNGVLKALLDIFGVYFDYFGRDPRLAGVFHKELLLPQGGRNRKEITDLTLRFLVRLADFIQLAQTRGELREDFSPLDAAANFFCLYYFMIQAWLGGYLGERQQLEERFRAALTLQIKGLAAAG